MQWNTVGIDDLHRKVKESSARTVLGYNEPVGHSLDMPQTNMPELNPM